MPLHLIPSFLFYCFISGITPGPANLTSLSAALNYGKGPALRQWRGLFTGFLADALIAAMVNFFLGAALGDYVVYLKWVGAAYIIYLAFHVLMSTQAGEAEADKRCNFFTGFFLQLTNVKVIIFCITALSTYVLPYNKSLAALLPVAFFLPLTGPMCNLVWLFAGLKLKVLFEKHRKVINIIMAIALVLCAISIVTSK